MFCLEAARNVSPWPDVDHSGTCVVLAQLVYAERLDIAAIQSVPRRLAPRGLSRRQRCGNAIRLNVRFGSKADIEISTTAMIGGDLWRSIAAGCATLAAGSRIDLGFAKQSETMSRREMPVSMGFLVLYRPAT